MCSLKKKVSLATLSVVTIIVAVSLLKTPILVQYHKRQMVSVRQKAVAQSLDDLFGRVRFHREELVDLGYLEKRMFSIKSIDVHSDKLDALLEEAREGFNMLHSPVDVAYAIKSEASDGVLTVWDKPENMGRWEKLLAEHLPKEVRGS